MVESLKTITKEMPEVYDFFLSVSFFSQPKSLQHNSRINSLVKCDKEGILISTSDDGLVKIWGLNGDYLGDLQISGNSKTREIFNSAAP